MTFNYKTRIDPKTGRAETYCDDPSSETEKTEKLARDKRELRDMLAGNLPFHTDPNAAPLPVPETRELPDLDWPNLTPGCVLQGDPPGDGWLLLGHVGGRRVWGRRHA